MMYGFKFFGDTKLSSPAILKFCYLILSKNFSVTINGEKNYFVVTSGQELIEIFLAYQAREEAIKKLTNYKLIIEVLNPKIKTEIISAYTGQSKYRAPKVFCVTQFVLLIKFLDMLSSESSSHKEKQVKYSIYHRFIDNIVEDESIIETLATAINLHKPIIEKLGLNYMVDFAKLAYGYNISCSKIN